MNHEKNYGNFVYSLKNILNLENGMKKWSKPVYLNYKFFQRFWLVALLLVIPALGHSQTSGAQNSRLQSGINLFGQGKWHEAIVELRMAQAEAASNRMKGEALFWISLSRLSAGEFTEALRSMDAVEEIDPESRRIPELIYHRGRALFYLERFDEAIFHLQKYADSIVPGADGVLTPMDSSKKSAALFWVGECHYSLEKLDEARDIYSIIIDDYPGSQKYEAAAYRLTLIDKRKIEMGLL